MMCRYQCLKSIADDICIIIIGMWRHSLFASMALGAGLKPEGGSLERRLMLVV
jgi:hypothetical protein